MKTILTLCMLCLHATAWAQSGSANLNGTVINDEGAWCWFADPRAIHYENASGTINATYIGYIDVHGNVKATQYDWLTGRKTDVLVRSYFQPDDHNNPTFLVLPDERVLIIYSRHTDEAAFYYRISRSKGDITALGEEKRLATANNTTYPSPFILSDDPDHWYLCWRGINWHPTIARLTMPDANDDVQFDFGPKQIVQSTGARPYAKYQSNGKDKIYLTYTTGHPDNEQPNWLYFNVIDINHGNGPILRDIKGTELKRTEDGVFNVNKTSSYASNYPYTVVDQTSGIRNWVWQITLDTDENPVIAFTHIDDAKTSHVYWYGRWTGTQWQRTWVQYAGHAFHQNWNSTERCYTGGMAIDPDNINQLYLAIPTTNGAYNKDGVYEIWRYTVDDSGTVSGSEQLTTASAKNNVRPFILPGSKDSPMRLLWMNGDYYYWMVQKNYPKGFPTSVMADYQWQETLTVGTEPTLPGTEFGAGSSLSVAFAMDASNYQGTLLTIGNMTYSIDASDQCPVITIGQAAYKSTNRLLTSDDWATLSTGTSGDNHPTKVDTWVLTLTYDGHVLTAYRNGLVDQVIETTQMTSGEYTPGTIHPVLATNLTDVCQSPATVQATVREMQKEMQQEMGKTALQTINLPDETYTDLVLPTLVLNQTVEWTSSAPDLLADGGTVNFPTEDTQVTLTARCGQAERTFDVTVHPRNIGQNLRYEHENLDLTGNTAATFAQNKFGLAPEGILAGLRSYTVLLTAKQTTSTKQPRFYDFGSGSGNSLFLRVNPLSAGIKYNNGTTTMVNAPQQLSPNQEYHLAVTFDAATKTTKIHVNGEDIASGTANQTEPYQLAQLAADTRNYIGRTQWWDTSYAADNQDFAGTIDRLQLYSVALTREEICQLQGIGYEEKELPTTLTNGDFEASYTKIQDNGVASDRAIYQPEGWTVDHANRNENDLTALKSGDPYYSNFFASRPAPPTADDEPDSRQTYWIRQNWGTSTLTLKQEIRLPEGKYTLDADVWKSGLGGDISVGVALETGLNIQAPAIENKEEWQHVSVEFESDGHAPTTVFLSAVHNSNGSEKIIGFDNVRLTPQQPDAVKGTPNNTTSNTRREAQAAYNLHGQPVDDTYSGIVIQQGKKKLKRKI